MLEQGDENIVLCQQETENKWMLVAGDQQRSRVWNPILKQIASCGYKPKNATINSTDATLSLMINRASSFLTKNTGLVVMYVLLHDLVRWAKDNTLHNNTGIMKAQRKPDLQQLAKEIAKADQAWKNFIPSLKVVWTIPLPIDFLIFNFFYVRKNGQDPLSEREIRACKEYTDIFQDNIHQLEMIFSVQHPEIDILKLDDLLTEDAMGVKIEKDGLMVKIDPDRPSFTGPCLPKMYSNHAKNAMMKYLVNHNFLPKPDQEVKLHALPKSKMPAIKSVTDLMGDVVLSKGFENMEATEPCKRKQLAPRHTENTVMHGKATLTLDQDSEDGFEGFEVAGAETNFSHTSETDAIKNEASKTDQCQSTSDVSGSKSAAHVHESSSVEVEESSTVVDVCTSLHVMTEKSSVAPDHDIISVVDVEEFIDAGDQHQSLDVRSDLSTMEEDAKNVDGLADMDSQADHSVNFSDNVEAVGHPEPDEADSSTHDSREDDMHAADVSKNVSESEDSAACDNVVQATSSDALNGADITSHVGTDGAHVHEFTSVKVEESITVVDVCTSLDALTEKSSVAPDHDIISVVDVEEIIDAGDPHQSLDVGSDLSTMEEEANINESADTNSQANHSVNFSDNVEAVEHPEPDEVDSLTHDSREDDMQAADVSKNASKSKESAVGDNVVQATSSDALSGADITSHVDTDGVIRSEDETNKKKWKEITWNTPQESLEMDVDDELIYDDAFSIFSEKQENAKQGRPVLVQKAEKMNEKEVPETAVKQRLDKIKSTGVLPLQKDPADSLLAKYFEKVPSCQENLMKKEQIFIGLQFIAELRITKANSSSAAPIYICILCNKQIASQTVLVSHVNSVPHKLKCAKLLLPAVHKRFGAIPLPEWTPNTLREFRENLQEAASHLLNYRICVVDKEQFNEASALINENLDKLEAFPQFSLDSIHVPLVATREEKLDGAKATSSVDDSVPSDVVTMPEDGTISTEETETSEVSVLIVGDNGLLSWPQSEHPKLCCSVHCQENATLPALIRMAGRMLNKEHRVLVMVAFLHDLVQEKDGFWFVKPKTDVNRLTMDVDNAIKFWEIKYPDLTVVWVLPRVLDLHRHNRSKLKKSDEDLTDEEKTMLEKSSKDSQDLDKVQSQLREQLRMSECWPVIYNLGETKQVELVDGFHPTEKSFDLFLKELEDFLLMVLEEHSDYEKITPAPQENREEDPTQEELRRTEIRKALKHRRARTITKFGLKNSSQPPQQLPTDAPNDNSARTSKKDPSTVCESKPTQPSVSQAELKKRLEVVRERLGYNTTLKPGGKIAEEIALGEKLISALSKNWDPANNNDSSWEGMRRRILSCVARLDELHNILQDKQELFTNEASSHPDYYNKWCEFYASHSAKLILQGVDNKDYDFSKDWLIEWHRYVIIILNNEQDKERQQILRVYGFHNVKMFELICQTYNIHFTVRKMEMTLSGIEKNPKQRKRADRKKFATPTPPSFMMDAHGEHPNRFTPHKGNIYATPHGGLSRATPLGEPQPLMGNLIEPDLIEQCAWNLTSRETSKRGDEDTPGREDVATPTNVRERLNSRSSGPPPPLRQSAVDKQESSSGFDVVETFTKLDLLKDILPTAKFCIADLTMDAKGCANLGQNPLNIFHLNKKNIYALHQIYTDLCESIDAGRAPLEIYQGLEGVRWLIEEVRKREFCGISLFKIAKDTEGLSKTEIFEIVNNALVEAKIGTSKHSSLNKVFMEIIEQLHAKAIEDKVKKVVGKLKVSSAVAKKGSPVEAHDDAQSYLSKAVEDVFPFHRDNSYDGPESKRSPNPDMQFRGAGQNPSLSGNRQRKKKGPGDAPSKVSIAKPPGWSRWVAPGQADASSVSGRGARSFGRGTGMISDSHHSGLDAEQWNQRDASSERSSRFSDNEQFSETGQNFNRFDGENFSSPGCPDRKRGRDQSLLDPYNPIEYDENESYKRARITSGNRGRAAINRGGPGNSRGGSGNSRGGPGNSRGGPGNSRGRPGNSRGRPGNSRGRPGNSRGRPENSRGRPENSRGRPENSRGRPGNSRGRGNFPSGRNLDRADGSVDSARDWKQPEQSKQKASGRSPPGPTAYTSPLDRPSFSTSSYGKAGPWGSSAVGPSHDKVGVYGPTTKAPSHGKAGAYGPATEGPSYGRAGEYGPAAEGSSCGTTGSSEPRDYFIGLPRPTNPSGFIVDNSRNPEFAVPTASPGPSGTRPQSTPKWIPPAKTRALAENSAFGGRLGVAANNWSSSAQPSSNQTPTAGSTTAGPKPVPPPSSASKVNINELIGNIIGSVDMTSNLARPSKGALNQTLSSMQLGGMQSFDRNTRSSVGSGISQPKSTQQELKDIIATHFRDLI